MPRESFQVASYEYYDWSSRRFGKTNLNLRGTKGEICGVWFIENPDQDLPPATKDAPNVYSFYYHHHQLQHLIDMLRYEKPIFVFFDNEKGFSNSRISTTFEPVGEGLES
ncbi:MAG: hypothetical protein MJA83_10560 [Gammaproteobacteria bacterium]|nr:hypothetical protein [Gammaproteobacteria bacterium]